MGNQIQNKLKLTMKTFATLALLGLAQAISIKEGGDPAPEADQWGHCATVRSILDSLAEDPTFDWAAIAAAADAPDDVSVEMLNHVEAECDAWDDCADNDDRWTCTEDQIGYSLRDGE